MCSDRNPKVVFFKKRHQETWCPVVRSTNSLEIPPSISISLNGNVSIALQYHYMHFRNMLILLQGICWTFFMFMCCTCKSAASNGILHYCYTKKYKYDDISFVLKQFFGLLLFQCNKRGCRKHDITCSRTLEIITITMQPQVLIFILKDRMLWENFRDWKKRRK